ncbi:MAG: class I SAM-dependent methyltransferase, partial [Clostridium sp.]|nr:class I SAM-dependent methyltransferase [Clostridium sp.]
LICGKTAVGGYFISPRYMVARTIMFDKELKELLASYPDAVCVNIGCGLDDRFLRVDNGKIEWFNVDLPDSIEVRKKVFAEIEREHMLAGSILEPDWMRDIPKERVTIVIAEGLLMYFSKEQVRTILHNITGSFERGFLLAELMHPKMMKEKVHDTVKHTNAKFGWGTKTGKELSELDPALKLIKEQSFWEEMKKYTFAGKLGSLLAKDFNNRLAVYRWEREA